jgi:hypothetical protein
VYLQDVRKVSIEPFLRWVADDAELNDFDDGFLLTEAPGLVVEMTHSTTPKTPAPPEKEAERCTDVGPPMNLPDVVQTAVRTKLATELKPVSDKLTRLRAVLDAFEVRAKQDAERRLTNAMLAALGEQQVDSDPAFETVRVELRDALSQVVELVTVSFGLPPPLKEQRTEPEPARSPAPPSQPAPVLVVHPTTAAEPPASDTTPAPPPSKPPRQLRQEDVAWAKRLIVEVEELKPEVTTHHPTRLFPLLQAITAEIRSLLDRLPEDNFLYERLSGLIPIIGAMKNEGGVEEFIRGLAFASTGDWDRLSFKNRRKVESYDRDADRSSVPPSQKPKALTPDRRFGTIGDLVKKAVKKDEPEPAPESNHQWPGLPYLRKVTKPILLAGGLIIPEKLVSVQERFGLDVEWHEIDHDNPRASQTLVSRIRSGKVGAVILLEGVMRHSTYKPVVEACNNNGVPYAMGDKAGVASLQNAFADLERKLKTQ